MLSVGIRYSVYGSVTVHEPRSCYVVKIKVHVRTYLLTRGAEIVVSRFHRDV